MANKTPTKVFTPEEASARFSKTVRETIEALSTMVKDLYDCNLTQRSTVEIDAIVGLVDKLGNKLVTMFLENKHHWSKILAREIRFFVDDLPSLFEGIPIDLSVLVVPVEMYLKHEEGVYEYQGELPISKQRTAGTWVDVKNKNPKFVGEFPLIDEDIDCLWKYFDEMLRRAVCYNTVSGNLHDLNEYEDQIKALTA